MSRWDTDVGDINKAGAKLKEQVVKCCEQVFGMRDERSSPIKIIKGNIPGDFDRMNSRNVVELEYSIQEVEENPHKVLNEWKVEIDADKKIGDKKAHFGFTIFKKGMSKVTGHVYFDKDPPFYRPKTEGKAPVFFGGGKDKANSKGTVWYEHSGKWYIRE